MENEYIDIDDIDIDALIAEQKERDGGEHEPENEKPQDDAGEKGDDSEEVDHHAEEKQEEPSEPKQEKKDTGNIPRARLNQEIEKRRALEARIAELESEKQKPAQQSQEQPAQEYDFKEAKKRLRQAQYEGDEELADRIEEELQAATEAKVARIAEERAQQLYEKRIADAEAAKAKTAVESVVSDAYAKYPFLDIEGDEANQDAIDEVVALRDLYIGRGSSPAEAITKAVEKVGPRYAPQQPAEQKPKPKVNIEEGMRRESRIPPRGGVGERAKEGTVEIKSIEDLEGMSAADIRRARGDYPD